MLFLYSLLMIFHQQIQALLKKHEAFLVDLSAFGKSMQALRDQAAACQVRRPRDARGHAPRRTKRDSLYYWLLFPTTQDTIAREILSSVGMVASLWCLPRCSHGVLGECGHVSTVSSFAYKIILSAGKFQSIRRAERSANKYTC